MDEYSDTWELLNKPLEPAADLSPKGRDLALIQANANSLRLTPEERYQMAWGEDATPEDWVKQKADAIRKEMDASASIAVLRQGPTAKAATAAAAAAAAAGAKPGTAGATPASGATSDQGNDGRGDGGLSSGSSSSGGGYSAAGSHSGMNSIGNTGIGSTLGGLIGSVVAGPAIGGRIGSFLGNLAESAAGRMGTPGVEGYGVSGLDGTTTAATGPGTIGSRDTHGSNESGAGVGPGSDASTDASSAGAVNGSDSQSDNASSGGGSSDSGSDGGMGGDGGEGGWSKGGRVTGEQLRGPDPAGPDDGHGALDIGEYVIRTSSVNHYGADVMAALNARRLPLADVRKLLNL